MGIRDKLCSLILEEHFGPIVQTIGNVLIINGKQTLRSIVRMTNLPLIKVKEVLCVLLKYGLVTYHQNQEIVEYMLNREHIIMFLRYPRYLFFVKTYCGNQGEVMLEEVLKHGYVKGSEVIIKTYKRLDKIPSAKKTTIANLKETFELLVKNQFLMHSVSFDTIAQNAEKPNYNLPNLDLKAISNLLEGQEDDPGDNQMYWKVNFDRFTQDIRDQIIISAISRRLDKNAGDLMRQLLNLMYVRTASWVDISNPIPYTEIKDAVRKLNCSELEQYLDQYLRLIEDDSHFIKRVGDSGGGQYSVNMKNAFKQLAWTTLENIITERFGSKAARIFRLVHHKDYIDQEEIQQLAMIPAKEAKLLMYTLLEENFLKIRETKKGTNSTAHAKTVFLYHIDIDEVVQKEIEHCYHALYNIMKRRDHESANNKRMVDKQLRIQTLSDDLKEHGATEQQLADIEEMMTESEKQQLEKAQIAIKKLSNAELQIDETLFLLTMYSRYIK